MPEKYASAAGDPASTRFVDHRNFVETIANCDRAGALDYRLLPAGDTALVVEFGDCIDRRISAKVLALAQRVNQAQLDGVLECVPTFRSLMVHYDPIALSTSSLSASIGELMQRLRVREDAGRVWQLPACYDPLIAPDLDQVAARTGLSAAQVVEYHSGATYHVYMLGFLPGTPYLDDVRLPDGHSCRMASHWPLPGPVSGATAAAHGTPRRGRQGHLRAGVAARIRAAGSTIRRRHTPDDPGQRAGGRGGMTPGLRVLAPGMLTTVQDLGRPGYQRLGIAVSGALDA